MTTYFSLPGAIAPVIIAILATSLVDPRQAKASQSQTSTLALVEVAPVTELTPVQRIRFSAHIHAYHNSLLSAGVSGKILWVKAPGTQIEKGEVVAKIDPIELTLQREEKLADIGKRQISLNYLQRELSRSSRLLSSNNTSAKLHDEIERQRNLANSDLALARVALQQIEEQLDRTQIAAPFSGVVVERHRRQGEEVARTDQLVRLVSIADLELRGHIPVSNTAVLNDASYIVLTDNKGTSQQFKLSTLVPYTDIRSQQVEVRARLNETRDLVPGQLIQAELVMAQSGIALAVHRDALVMREDGIYVVVIDHQGKAKRVSVERGLEQGELVIVNGSLQRGDRVAVRGAEGLQNGDFVQIKS